VGSPRLVVQGHEVQWLHALDAAPRVASMKRRLPSVAEVMARPLGYAYTISRPHPGGPFKAKRIPRKFYTVQTTKLVRAEIITQKFYEEPPWMGEMRALANPWHVRRRWQVELGFKLLAVARGEAIKFMVTEN
jgi:hypothetical protein